MDGINLTLEDQMVMVLATTNAPWESDSTLIRRLEKRLYIPLPDYEARLQMFEINLRTVRKLNLSGLILAFCCYCLKKHSS
jgi:katanin p60 ATPase-containing subunit A1